MTFKQALVKMLDGKMVRRKSWKNKSYCIFLTDFGFFCKYMCVEQRVTLKPDMCCGDDWEIYQNN